MNTSESVPNTGLGDTLTLLGSRRRRLVLATLDDRDTVSVSDLARDLVAAEDDKPPTAVTPEEQRRTKIQLHHADLPPLSAAGLVSYDSQRQVVRVNDLPLEGEEWLEMPVAEALESWNR
jgi:hypothetical protein